jgi:hypothetical protein
MEYSKIIAVTGLPGLYELISSKSDGAVVRSLDDKSTKFVSSRVHNFSNLESIEVFTRGENVNLVDVFKTMKESNSPLPDDKDNNGIRKYFEKVYPDMDFEKVYSSDMKKMVKWFEVLTKNNIEFKITEPEEVPVEEVKEDAVTSRVKEKPEKKQIKKEEAPKKQPPPKKEEPVKKKKEAAEEKPKKKVAAKAKKVEKKSPPKKAAKKKK